VHRYYRLFLPLFPWAIQRFRLEGYDLVISTSHAVAKGVRVEPGTPHLCYCFTPMRYIWDQADTYLGKGLKRFLVTPLVQFLRRWDKKTARDVSQFIGISKTVSARIEKHYGKPAPVIYPPVDLQGIQPSGQAPENFFLLVGGFVPYKREEIAIEAFRNSRHVLMVAGDGPRRSALEATAPGNVKFLGRVSDEELKSLYQRCRALIYPQDEDFGIVAVEAQAAGRPVIALGRGGAAETVVPIQQDPQRASGLWFDEQTAQALRQAIEEFQERESQFSSETIRENAELFSTDCFLLEFQEAVAELLARK
ncbi:MAG: glycosyltransferase, partial [Deltaproteobacteria bacterium]|nr:glycosyltransferase [Deltaproteobacteria bacterium]